MLFSDPFRDLDLLTSDFFRSLPSQRRSVPMDAWRDDAALYLSFEVPGVSKDAINLEVEKGTLTLTVDKPVPEVAGKRLMGERGYGRVTRSLTLGDTFDLDSLEAKLTDGVLELTLPLAEREKPRRISIEAKSDEKELTAAE